MYMSEIEHNVHGHHETTYRIIMNPVLGDECGSVYKRLPTNQRLERNCGDI
jgi:hypothetical protein